MKSIMRKAAAYGLVLAMGCTSLAGCGKNGAKIDGSKTLMTVNGEDLRMGVASFYTRFQQAQMYQFYSMYFGSGAAIFDTVEDEATGKTYGDDIKEEVLSELEKLVIINQHADEFGVSLTDEQKANITAAAEAYIASNDQAVLDKVGAAKEDVEKLLTLQTVQSLMMDPIVKDVDREVPDEDAQQTTLTYVAVNVAEEEASETSEAEAQSEAAVSEATTSEATAESETAVSEATASETSAVESEAAVSETAAVESEAAASETAAVESEAAVSETAAVESEAAVSETAAVESEAAASETAAVESEAAASETAAVESETAESEEEETEAQKAARADAEAILEAVMAESMIAEADMDAIARTVNDTYYAATGQFTTNDPADADVDSSVAEAAAGLEDGELVDHVVKSADGTRYYVVRVDHVFDEEATAEKKKSIIEERKQTLYDETTDGWVESADIKVDENVWKTLTLTDMEPVTLKAPEVQSEAESAESAVSEQETAESTVSSVAAAAESTVSSAAETAESTVSSAAVAAESTVSSAAEAADSAVTSAVETAESTVASVAAAVDSAAESAAGTAAAVESKVEAAAEELESTVEGLESAAETAVNEYEDAVASTVEEAAAEAVSVAEAVENTVASTVSTAETAVSQAAETANTAAASSGKTNAAAEAAAAAAAAAAADLSGSAAK